MKKLDEIIEELRAWAENCMWTTGHENELFGMADDLEVIRAQIEQMGRQHYDDLLAKALKGGTVPSVVYCKDCELYQQTQETLGVCSADGLEKAPGFFCALGRFRPTKQKVYDVAVHVKEDED